MSDRITKQVDFYHPHELAECSNLWEEISNRCHSVGRAIVVGKSRFLSSLGWGEPQEFLEDPGVSQISLRNLFHSTKKPADRLSMTRSLSSRHGQLQQHSSPLAEHCLDNHHGILNKKRG